MSVPHMLFIPCPQSPYISIENLYPELMDVEQIEHIIEEKQVESEDDKLQSIPESQPELPTFGTSPNDTNMLTTTPPIEQYLDLFTFNAPPQGVFHNSNLFTHNLINIIFNSYSLQNHIKLDSFNVSIVAALNVQNGDISNQLQISLHVASPVPNKFSDATCLYTIKQDHIQAQSRNNVIEINVSKHIIEAHRMDLDPYKYLKHSVDELKNDVTKFITYKKFLVITYFNLEFSLPIILFSKTLLKKHFSHLINSYTLIDFLENLGGPQQKVKIPL